MPLSFSPWPTDPGGKLFALPDAGCIDQHPPGPTVDVEVADQGAHAAHPLPLFEIGHRQGLEQGIGRLLYVIGVDDQGLVQFMGRAGKLAEHQNAPFIVAAAVVMAPVMRCNNSRLGSSPGGQTNSRTSAKSQ